MTIQIFEIAGARPAETTQKSIVLPLQFRCRLFLCKLLIGKGRAKGNSQPRQPGQFNPLGPDGKRMTCHTCGSDKHFMADCPANQGKGSSAHVAEAHYVSGVEPTLNGIDFDTRSFQRHRHHFTLTPQPQGHLAAFLSSDQLDSIFRRHSFGGWTRFQSSDHIGRPTCDARQG